MLQATPATWRMLVDANWRGSQRLTALCGGEPLPLALANTLTSRCKTLWNVYGPTETTVWSTAGLIAPGATRIDIGEPIANTRVHILDDLGNPAPTGVEGDVVIAGVGLARGYRNRPELDAEAFYEHAGERAYRTGDRGRWLPNDRLQHLGRTDAQLKVRGFRIEAGDVESKPDDRRGSFRGRGYQTPRTRG